MGSNLSKDEIKMLLKRELELLKSEGILEISMDSEPEKNEGNSGDFGGFQTEKNEGIREISTTSETEGKEKMETLRPAEEAPFPLEKVGEVELPEGEKSLQWEFLRHRVLQCPICNAHVKFGKKVVFGVGNLDADIFFCGEAPGADEEIQGEPFVGRAGQLLTKIIEAAGLRRSEVYIGNIMNWRPEMPTNYGNRPPTQEEMECCLPYLKAQLQIVQPKVIVALGATAVHGLLGYDSQRRMGDVRGHWFQFENIPLLITYHPSYLLRNASNASKRLVWEDFLQIMEFLKMPISEKQRVFFLE